MLTVWGTLLAIPAALLTAYGAALAVTPLADAEDRPRRTQTAAAVSPATAEAGLYWLTADRVNVRTGPGVKHTPLTQAGRGQLVTVHCHTRDDDGRFWSLADLWGGPEGMWVATEYLDLGPH